MAESDNREQELKRKEEELRAKEREIRLRELEIEVDRQHKNTEVDSSEAAFHPTQKHNPTDSNLQTLSKKIVKFAKFFGFVVVGFSLIRLGLLVGVWLSYIGIISLVAFIGYHIFLKKDDRHS